MKIKIAKTAFQNEFETCKNCGNSFKGKVCNVCGESVFNVKQLSAKHFLHEVIDFFYHFENKVLKTIKLNFLKPGFITQENFRGVRVPYAKPIQLYLVVAIVFYIFLSITRRTDYIPSHNDHNYFALSNYSLLKWAKPVDNWVDKKIDSMWIKKGVYLEKEFAEENLLNLEQDGSLKLYGRKKMDSITIENKQVKIVEFHDMLLLRRIGYYHSVGHYSKTLIFILIPIFAFAFLVFYYRKIPGFGGALILATHFLIYSLCINMLYTLINILPGYINSDLRFWMTTPFESNFYIQYIEPNTQFLFHSSFELMQIICWIPWLYIAFRRLFKTVWWKNLLISYICSRVFFFITFGVFKKILIAFTIWQIH